MKSLFRDLFKTVFLLLALPFLPLAALAQTPGVDSATAAALQNRLDAIRALKNVKGLSASVIIPGKGTWNGVSGVSHDTVPIDTAMVFAIGSVSKNFTATAILLLQEDGALSVNDSLHQYLPSFPNIDSTITIKQLLQHRSGIYNYTDNTAWQNAVNNSPSQPMLPLDVLNNYIGNPTGAPGSGFRYSNTNYLLLGLIIEEASGMEYHSFIRQRVLDPHQLNSFYVAENEPATGVAPHNWSDPDMNGSATDIYNFPLTAVFGSSPADGALTGTPNDLARYGQLLYTGQILQDSSLQQMLQFGATMSSTFNGYGLGTMRFMLGGHPVWGHSGNIAGFAATLAFSPTDSIVVALASNQDVISTSLALSMLQHARLTLVSATTPEVINEINLTCFPNPTTGKGTIEYTLQQPEFVQISLLNSIGREVKLLEEKLQQPGGHRISVDTRDLPAGLYFCTFKTKNSSLVKRWVITK